MAPGRDDGGRKATAGETASDHPLPGNHAGASDAPSAEPRQISLMQPALPRTTQRTLPHTTRVAAPAGIARTPKAARPALAFDELLLDALTHGDVPVPEFENCVRDLGETDVKALYMRLAIVPPPASDKLATAFFQVVPEADRSRIIARLGNTTKNYTKMHMWAELAPGEDTTAMQLITRVDALDGVYLRSQPFGNKTGARLPFDTLVAVSRRTSRGWYHVSVLGDAKQGGAPAGESGFIEEYHVASKMPEPSAHLHQVKSGELLHDIAAQYYKHSFGWGHDARLFVQAIYHANKDRAVVFRQQADLTVNQAALKTDNLIDALAFWKEARVVAGQALWMPSHDFVGRLAASGAIHHASVSTAVWTATAGAASEALELLTYAGGFAAGLLEGAWGALEDLFMGIVDLLKMLWTIVKDIFNDFAEIKAFATKISDAWKNRDKILVQIASDFMSKWESPDDWARGNFQGEVLGYVMMTAFITLVTLGAGATIAGAGRFGAFIKLIQLADAAGDITTYTRKLLGKIKLPARAVDRATDALTPKLAKVTGPDTPHGPHKPHGEPDAPHATAADNPGAPHTAANKPDTPHTAADTASSHADAPHATAPEPAHVPRPASKNKGEPYVNPMEHPDLPHAHLEKHEMPKLDPKPEAKFKKLEKRLKTEAGIAVGRKLKDAQEGHAIIEGLARGDASALEKLGIAGAPHGYDTTGREWALVEGRDGFFIYAGRYGDVSVPAGARVHAHNHPSPKADAGVKTTKELPVPHEGKTFTELIEDQASTSAAGLAPSLHDIHAVSDGADHVIYTRYVHRGDGKIANPIPSDTDPRVAIHLAAAKVVRFDPKRERYLYQVSVQLRDSTGRQLWSGEMYGDWYALAKNGNLYFSKPGILKQPPLPGWIEP